MKRLIKSEYIPQIGDNVTWKKHPYDNTIYKIMDIMEDGTVFIDNGDVSYTNIKPSTIKKVDE